MKGYYVISVLDTEEFKTRKEALKRAKEIYDKGLDNEVFIQSFNDDDVDGYLANGEVVFIKDYYNNI